MKITPLFVGLLLSLAGLGQAPDTLNRRVEPKGGMAALALIYYKIDFNPEEVAYLRSNEAELIFMVSEKGKAVLEKVNDIGMLSIVDSMMRVNDQLPEFHPELVDGKPQSALYFLRLRWPQYTDMHAVTPYNMQRANYVTHPLNEFEYVNYTGARFDMVFGGVANLVNGSASDYIRNGGGMKMDMMFYGKKGWGGGMVMTFHGNRAKKDYPISTSLRQNPSRMTLFLGAGIGKVLDERGRGHFNIQFEPCWAVQNIVTVDPHIRSKPVQASGFSPGFVVNYALRIGNGRLYNYYFMPTAWKSYLNLHLAVRPLMLNVTAASGMMFEAGLSYRMGLLYVSDFKLK
jgi:hypothetical protein